MTLHSNDQFNKATVGRARKLTKRRLIKFSEQWGEYDTFRSAECRIERGEQITTAELALVLKNAPDRAIPPRLKQYLIEVLQGTIRFRKPRGRKPKSDAQKEFSLLEVDELYQRYLPEFQRERRRQIAAGKLPGGSSPSPSELAYRRILKEKPNDFPNLDWKALRNQHSQWRQGKLPRLRPDPNEDPGEF